MIDESNKWDKQWNVLLTRCHGEEVKADAGFKSGLLDELKRKTAENLDSSQTTDESTDANWRRLLTKTYIPCHHDEQFKSVLLTQLQAKQREMAGPVTAEVTEDTAIRTILSKSYQPVSPRREFQTRLLHNLKERQRNTAVVRRKSRRRTFIMSAASSIAAAAMVMFVAWIVPQGVQGRVTASSNPEMPNLNLPIPETAMIPAAVPAEEYAPQISRTFIPASFETPASFAPEERVQTRFASYSPTDAFSGPALPERVYAYHNMEMDSGKGWASMASTGDMAMLPGMSFRTKDSMGHMEFEDGSLISFSPDSILDTTDDGLTVKQGFMLVSVPDTATNPFRLHFSERDIAIEPGTDLAVMVESPEKYAEGGAPAPLVMVVDRQDSPGGFALAKGKGDIGIGPLLAKQLYRLDNYVTPNLPGRTMCDTECQDLDKMFKMETVRRADVPMTSLASGGFTGFQGSEANPYSVVISPAGFSKKGDRWLADSYKDQPTVKIQYLSNEYFGLANSRRDLALALALGGKVVIDSGDGTFYEIHQ